MESDELAKMSAVATPPKPPLSAAARKRLIEARQQRSLFWRVVHVLGSLKLALVLLATIAIAIAVATFCESSFNTKVAQAYIYKAPWFVFWLGVLCINLFCVTLTRWPWQRQHAGFIITHYGIILLLAGAVVGMKLGFEGNVTLHTGQPPVGRITTSRSVLQVESPADGARYLIPFDAELARPSARRPDVLDLPGTRAKLVVTGFSENLLENESLAASSAPEAGPGVELKLSSAMAGQDLRMPLAQRNGDGVERDFFGLARIAWLSQLPDRTPAPIKESQMVFAKFAPVIQGEGGSTGITFILSEDGAKLTATAPDGTSATYDRSEVAGTSIRVGQASAAVRQYWPDFKIVNGQPATASALPNNPAILILIEGPAQSSGQPAGQPLLEMAPAPKGGGIVYQLSRGGVIYASGEAAAGGRIELGWADWSAEVTRVLPKAATRTTVEPGPDDVTGIPGFLGQLREPGGTPGPAQWIPSGATVTLGNGHAVVRLAYGLELRPVPFTIGLKNFEVPRYEGTETPANFIATVEFADKATGETKGGVAKMNHPASWPGGFVANATGVNYKFSQAEWNPRDLGETTLQVLYDPGWLMKWTGSLAICIGIFTMFYLRPKNEPRT